VNKWYIWVSLSSGSPVYALKSGPSGYVVWAYGVVSGSNGDTVVAPIDWMDVKLW